MTVYMTKTFLEVWVDIIKFCLHCGGVGVFFNPSVFSGDSAQNF